MSTLTLIKKLIISHPIYSLLFIKVCGVSFALLVFARHTPLIDSQLYLNGFYRETTEFRTKLISTLATSLEYSGGAYLTHYTFAIISASGLIYYYQTGGKRWLLLLTMLPPSILVWASIVGKEAIYCGAAGITLVIWSKYVTRALRFNEILIATAALLLCFFLRPHYSIALFWLFIARFSMENLKEKSTTVLFLLFLIGFTLVYFFLWDELLNRAYTAIEPSARASRHEIFEVAPNSLDGFKQFKSLVSLGMLISIIGPLPAEVINRVEFIPFFIEGAMILISPLLVYSWANKHCTTSQLATFNKMFWCCLAPSILILMLMHAPFGILNPGSATRWRTNFEQVFYLAPLLLLYRLIDKDTE